MPIIKCTIDRNAINKWTKHQRELGQKVILVDPSGLRLAINARSSSWNYNYRKRGVDYQGKRHPQRTLRIGDPITMSPQQARLRVEEIKAEVRDGGDPASSMQHNAQEERQREYQLRPLYVWLEDYRSHVLGYTSRHKRDEYAHAKSALVELNIANTPPVDLNARVLRELAVIHSERPSTGRHRFGALSRFLDYLVDEDVIERNPAKDISRRHRPKASAPRETFYSTDELRLLWNPPNPLRPDYLRFLRFLIICPLRMTEAAELRGDNIFADEKELRLSHSETKNNEAFTLPLPRIALQLINEASAKKGTRCFQLSSIDGAPMRSWSFFNKAVRRASGVDQFNLHHLRRTFATLMSEHSNFEESVIDAVLNHKRSATRAGVMRSYQHAKNIEKRRNVMDAWESFLLSEVIDEAGKKT
jgi:integrase